MDLATLLPVSLKEIPTTPQASCNFMPLVIRFSHPLGTSQLCRMTKPTLNAHFSLEIKRYAATAPAPDMRTLVALAHRRSTFSHLEHLKVKYIQRCLPARLRFRYYVPPPLLLLPRFFRGPGSCGYHNPAALPERPCHPSA